MVNYDELGGNDRQGLISNIADTAYDGEDDINAGGFISDGNTNVNIIPATLPISQEHNDDVFQNVDLQGRVLISDAPSDKCNFTYVVFYLLGTATMTPWNFFITAEDVSSALLELS